MHVIEEQLLDVNAIQLCIHSCGPADGPVVWLLHGFPECWLSWRKQMPALAAAGYRVFAPEMRGYGRSSAPAAVADYDLLTLCGDIQAAMDALGQHQVCMVGHDWGALVAWHLALLEPKRIKAVVGMSVPFGGRPKKPIVETLRQVYAGRFNYILYFQQPGVAERELDADIPRTLRLMMHNWSAAVGKELFWQDKPATAGLLDGLREIDQPPAWCEPQAFAGYVATYAAHGFRGPLNWYRNFERNWQRTAVLQDARIEQPALFLIGDEDPVGVLEAYTIQQMPRAVPQLHSHVLENCGHWLQCEQPDAVNQRLLAFLADHYPAQQV